MTTRASALERISAKLILVAADYEAACADALNGAYAVGADDPSLTEGARESALAHAVTGRVLCELAAVYRRAAEVEEARPE
jgi:hypothetical protein